MKMFAVGFGVLLASLFVSSANAALVVSIESPVAAFAANSGFQSVNVFARGNGVGADSGIVLTADFSLGGGATFNNPAGTFGGVGFIGNNNITAAGSSFARDPGNASVGNLSIEYTLTQAFALSNGLLATLSINTNGLLPGTYAINVTDAQLDGNLGGFTGGSFQIAPTAVPEPGSAALLGVICVGGVLVHKRRKAKNAAVVAAA